MSVRASIVVVARNGWKVTRDCLACLADTIRTGDEIIVVDDATNDSTQCELARRSGITVVRNQRQLGWIQSAQAGLTAATHPIVVFLDPATLPAGSWLDLLTVPLDTGASTFEGFDAIAPMSNIGPGPQRWPSALPYLNEGTRGLRSFVDDLASTGEARLQRSGSIDPFCFAVTAEHARSLIVAMGSGTEPTCRLAVRSDVFVHRVGPAQPVTAPTMDFSRLAIAPLSPTDRMNAADGPTLVSIRSVAVVGHAVADLLDGLGSRDIAVIELADPIEIANRDDIDVLVLTDVDAGDPPPRWASSANAITVALNSTDASRVTWCDHNADRDISISELIDVVERIDSFGAALVQARHRLESGEIVDAIDALTRAEGQRPDSPQVANCLGVCAYLLGDEEAARHSFQRAIQLDATYQPAIDNLGGLR